MNYHWNEVRFQSGRPALLVCADYECDHEEPVAIVHAPQDAVILAPVRSDWVLKDEHPYEVETPDAIDALLARLRALHARTGARKLPSAIRHWSIERSYKADMIAEAVARSAREGVEIACRGPGCEHVGRVVADFAGSFLLEQDGGATVMLKKGELSLAGITLRRSRFKQAGGRDFGDGRWPGWGCKQQALHSHFVAIDGHELNCEQVSELGVCYVFTYAPAAARALGFYSPYSRRWYSGAFPVELVQRHYRKRWFYHALGERMELSAPTTDPEVLVLKTTSPEAARRFGLLGEPQYLGVAGRQRYWYGYFRLGELSAPEVQVEELPLPQPQRPRTRRKS